MMVNCMKFMSKLASLYLGLKQPGEKRFWCFDFVSWVGFGFKQGGNDVEGSANTFGHQ